MRLFFFSFLVLEIGGLVIFLVYSFIVNYFLDCIQRQSWWEGRGIKGGRIKKVGEGGERNLSLRVDGRKRKVGVICFRIVS